MKIHKKHIRWPETVCAIKYNKTKDIIDFVNNQLSGHWDKVTCKNCIKQRKNYEKSLKEWRRFS